MSNRLRLTGILTPPSDDAWQPGVGYVKFEPADERAANWGVPGYRPAWPILGVPNALGNALMEINGGDVFVPGDEPGDTYAGPQMRVTYELRTLAGTWHRGSFLWRAVSTGGGVIDLRTPAPEGEPPHVSRPGVPAGALLTTDVDNLVPSLAAFAALEGRVRVNELMRVTWLNDNSQSPYDRNNYPVGLSFMVINAGSGGGWPEEAGLVQTIVHPTQAGWRPGTHQWFFMERGQRVWHRHGSDPDGWSNWQRLEETWLPDNEKSAHAGVAEYKGGTTKQLFNRAGPDGGNHGWPFPAGTITTTWPYSQANPIAPYYPGARQEVRREGGHEVAVRVGTTDGGWTAWKHVSFQP